MRIFVFYPIKEEWDMCESIAIIAPNLERAVEIAIEEEPFLKDNIDMDLIEVIDTDKENHILTSIKWG